MQVQAWLVRPRVKSSSVCPLVSVADPVTKRFLLSSTSHHQDCFVYPVQLHGDRCSRDVALPMDEEEKQKGEEVCLARSVAMVPPNQKDVTGLHLPALNYPVKKHLLKTLKTLLKS